MPSPSQPRPIDGRVLFHRPDRANVQLRTAYGQQGIDNGLLEGYRLPGDNGERRVTRESLLKFLGENNMPIPEQLGEPRADTAFVEKVRELSILRTNAKITNDEFIRQVEVCLGGVA